jgi:hypothetical protein
MYFKSNNQILFNKVVKLKTAQKDDKFCYIWIFITVIRILLYYIYLHSLRFHYQLNIFNLKLIP